METILDTENARIRVDCAKQFIVLEWIGFVPGQEHRRIWNEATTLANDQGLRYWLIDLQEASLPSSTELRWTFEVWYPHAIAHIPFPFKVAILPYQNAFGEAVLHMQLSRQIPQKGWKIPDIAYFRDEQEAMEWLFGQNLV